MRHNVAKEDLEEIETMMDKIHDKLAEMTKNSPLLDEVKEL